MIPPDLIEFESYDSLVKKWRQLSDLADMMYLRYGLTEETNRAYDEAGEVFIQILEMRKRINV